MITNETLIDILVKSGADVEKQNVKPDQPFEDMGLDSLDMFNFFTQIDDDLEIEVPDEVFEQLDTLEKVRAYIESKMNG